MTDDERKADGFTSEEIAELVRARKARTKWGALFVIVGVLGFLLSAIVLLLREAAFGLPELGLLGMFFAMGAVGAGYAEPSELSSLWKK